MPTKSLYTLSPGKLYINDTIVDVGCIPDITHEDTTDIIATNVTTSGGATFTATLTANRFTFYKLIGIYDFVIDRCPNRRVAHLIKHGKTKRVRAKNFNRACRILEKEATK